MECENQTLKNYLKHVQQEKLKEKQKKLLIHYMAKSGMGYAKNPKKSINNKVYKKTSFGLNDILKIFK